jgi:fucokinase
LSPYSSANSSGYYPYSANIFNSVQPDNISAEWDFIFLTAMNEKQALSYRKQIEYRLKTGVLRNSSGCIVVPDTDGKRIGSGGAVFNVLKHIRDKSVDDDCFLDKRILIINSGGDSMRIPQYSACGKIFAPVARELSEGVSATLFDELIKSLAALPSRMPAGFLIASGDILLEFDPFQIELSGCDAASLSVSVNSVKGKNHGVFIQDKQGNVKKFLHKSPIGKLQSSGAEDSTGNVHLDTGTIWLSSRVVEDLFALICTGGKIEYDKFAEFANEKSRLSIYADFVYPMARDSSLDQFYLEKPDGNYTNELKNCRTALWQVLHKYTMKLVDLSPAVFIHFGTTAELLKMMTVDIVKYNSLGWKREVNTNTATCGRFSVNSSFIDEFTEIGDGSYIENSSIYNSKIGKNCIVSNITLDSVEIPDNMVVHSLKQNDGDYVARIYGINDDPKRGYDDGGIFLGVPIREFMKKHQVKIPDLWSDEPHNLWNAKVYCKSGSPSQSLKYALSFCVESAEICESSRRVSLRKSYENADVDNTE